MTALDPLDLELLYFLCAASHHHCRVVRVKGPRLASLKRLREAGFVGADGFEPFAHIIFDWLARRDALAMPSVEHCRPRFDNTETPAGDQIPALAEPPAPKAVDEGGRRCSDAGAPPPIDLDRLLSFFSDEFEQLFFVARRHGGVSTAKIVRHASALLRRGLVEQLRPTSKRPHCLWRRAKLNTIPSPEVASPSVDPPAVAPTAAGGAALDGPKARPRSERSKVDIKVNARRDPTKAPPTPYSPEKQDYLRGVSAMQRTNRAKAEAFLDSGKTSQDAGSVSLRIEARKVEIDRAEEARRTDPLEQAKVVIRRAKRCAVFGAEVSGGPAGKFYVGTRLVTRAELLAMAKGLAA